MQDFCHKVLQASQKKPRSLERRVFKIKPKVNNNKSGGWWWVDLRETVFFFLRAADGFRLLHLSLDLGSASGFGFGLQAYFIVMFWPGLGKCLSSAKYGKYVLRLFICGHMFATHTRTHTPAHAVQHFRTLHLHLLLCDTHFACRSPPHFTLFHRSALFLASHDFFQKITADRRNN